ncbi:apolipoprotein D-like isoform X2 [Phymastichus coffea]|uniref:apolipoprotein D-like isoform X2 n=1 Tax=Phymastichus coffea TaxID=108790 RepID=UPI00273AEE1D|nr:apolipoprotein D-like isoform X2 [Phymastichus coffea]
MLAYFTLLFLGSTFAQVILPGKCPAVSVKSDFDVQQYIGRWFEQRRYFAIFQFGLQCVTATYSANNNGTVNIVNQGTYPLIGVKPSITGLAYAKTAEKAKLSVIFPSLPVHVEGSYWILDTDYISYAVVWSCTNISFISFLI